MRHIGSVSSSVRYAASVGFFTQSVGPPARLPSGVIEVTTVHRNGNSMMTAPASTAAYRSRVHGERGRRFLGSTGTARASSPGAWVSGGLGGDGAVSGSGIVDPPALAADL